MHERKIEVSLWSVATWTAWVAVAVLLLLAPFVRNLYVAAWGLGLSAAAATLTVRGFVCRLSRLMRNVLEVAGERRGHVARIPSAREPSRSN